MNDRATANLPSRNLDRTAEFYQRLGFSIEFKDEGWMILTRGAVVLEFFPFPVDPKKTIASACIRVDDLDALFEAFDAPGMARDCWSIPRITEPKLEPWGMRMFALIDKDGNLLRCIQNNDDG